MTGLKGIDPCIHRTSIFHMHIDEQRRFTITRQTIGTPENAIWKCYFVSSLPSPVMREHIVVGFVEHSKILHIPKHNIRLQHVLEKRIQPGPETIEHTVPFTGLNVDQVTWNERYCIIPRVLLYLISQYPDPWDSTASRLPVSQCFHRSDRPTTLTIPRIPVAMIRHRQCRFHWSYPVRSHISDWRVDMVNLKHNF